MIGIIIDVFGAALYIGGLDQLEPMEISLWKGENLASMKERMLPPYSTIKPE